jgi:hypothetical protein
MPSGLLCGVATADITPRAFVPGIRLAGFEPDRRARAVLERLEAGAVHLSDGRNHATLVTLDLIGFLHPHLERVRDLLAGRHPDPGRVLVASTHTHAGPDTIGLWGRALFGTIPIASGVDDRYMAFLLDRVAQVAADAAASLVPVSVRGTRFDVPASLTRNDRMGGGKDDHGEVLCFDREDGSPLALIVNFACHPETLWEGNPLVSPDYPGALRRRLRALSDGGTPLFFSGALGGMVTPDIPVESDLEYRKEAVERIGVTLADCAWAALEGVRPLDTTPLSVTRIPLALPVRNWRHRLSRHLGILDREFLFGSIRTEMNLVRFGADASLLTAPGECTPEVGRELQVRMTGRHRLLFCLGCDEIGYILTPGQYEDPEYRYERSMSLGPDTATLLYEAVEREPGFPSSLECGGLPPL